MPLAFVVFLALGLLVPAQTADMLAGMTDGGYHGMAPAVAFHAALAFLAFSAWHWSRAALTARFPEMVFPRETRLKVPRAPVIPHASLPVLFVFGLFIGGVVLLIAARSGDRLDTGLLLAATVGVPAIWVVCRRGGAAADPTPGNAAAPAARIDEDPVPRIDPTAWDWIPRLVFLIATGAGLLAALRSDAWVNAALVLVWAVPMMAFLVFRRRLLPPDPGPGEIRYLRAARWNEFRREMPARFRMLMRLAPFGAGIAKALLILGLLPLAWTVLAVPSGLDAGLSATVRCWHGVAMLLGSIPGPGGLILALALMMPVLTTIAFIADGLLVEPPWSEAFRRPPVILPIVLLVVVVPTIVPLHIVPVITGATAPNPTNRKQLGELFATWVATCARGAAAGQPVRPVIVAVSGGASRAALWAARVLRDVETALPPKDKGGPAIFAVSSVSGGSLGAAAWASVLAGQRDGDHCRTRPDTVAWGTNPALIRADAALSQLGQDVLSAPLAALLVDDMPRAVLGWVPALFGYQARGNDRGQVQERSFDRLWNDASREAWKGESSGPVPFKRGFLRLAYGSDRQPLAGMPLWLPNSTEAESGRRIIPTAFASDTPTQWPFRETGDMLALLGADLPIAAAVLNSARFAYLSPTGELIPAETADRLTDARHGERPANVIDGGYFDNSGMQTALELAEWLTTSPAARQAAGGRDILPILVQVTADGERAVVGDKVLRCDTPPRDDPASSDALERPVQGLAPVLGLNASRNNHGALLQRTAHDTWCRGFQPNIRFEPDSSFQAEEQTYFHFYLHAPPDADVPLNWTLSDRVATWIWRDAMSVSDNRREMERLRAAFGNQAPYPATPCPSRRAPGSE